MDKTPIQQAIEFWTKRAQESPTHNLRAAAEMFVRYLNSMIPKEREFAEKCFEAGEAKGWFHEGPSIKPGPPPPDKQQFINQLYPKS